MRRHCCGSNYSEYIVVTFRPHNSYGAYLFSLRLLSQSKMLIFLRRNINIWAHRLCSLLWGDNLTTKCCWTNFRQFVTAFLNSAIPDWPEARNRKRVNEFHFIARGQRCGKCARKALFRWRKRDHNATLSLYCIHFTLGDAKCIFQCCTWGLRWVELCWLVSSKWLCGLWLIFSSMRCHFLPLLCRVNWHDNGFEAV